MNGSARLPLALLLKRSTWILILARPTCKTKPPLPPHQHVLAKADQIRGPAGSSLPTLVAGRVRLETERSIILAIHRLHTWSMAAAGPLLTVTHLSPGYELLSCNLVV